VRESGGGVAKAPSRGGVHQQVSDAEAEAAETQVWIEFAVSCGYLAATRARAIYATYDKIIGTLVGMINHTASWVIRENGRARH